MNLFSRRKISLSISFKNLSNKKVATAPLREIPAQQ
jgi:hypothetical protein